MMGNVRGKTEFRKCYDVLYRILRTFYFRVGETSRKRPSAFRGLLRKLCESLLRERERIRLHSYRSLKRLINFRDGDEHERQQQREHKYVKEMQREILAAEKACRPDHYNSADQNCPQNSGKFHPAFNLPQPPESDS